MNLCVCDIKGYIICGTDTVWPFKTDTKLRGGSQQLLKHPLFMII